MFYFNFNLRTKFIVYICIGVLLIAFCFLSFFGNRSDQLIEENLIHLGFHLVEDVAEGSELAVASEDPVLLHPFFEGTFDEEKVILVTVYNREGYIISSKEKKPIQEKISQDIINKLASQRKAIRKINYTDQQEKFFDFYAPILTSKTTALFIGEKKGKLIGFARVGVSLKEMKAKRREMLFSGVSITALIVGIGALAAVYFSKKLIGPIKSLTRGAESISKGDLDYRIKVRTGDEIEQLAQELNLMAENLQENRERLKESKQVLEIKVKARTRELEELAERREQIIKERTKELQDRVKELERFHRLTVGRELKMVELKKKLRKANQKIKELEADQRG